MTKTQESKLMRAAVIAMAYRCTSDLGRVAEDIDAEVESMFPKADEDEVREISEDFISRNGAAARKHVQALNKHLATI